eukprot:TRINITY_DN24616_c0_g1_i2.p1 TRINITY_DN24616_c0_g1~~TRINITY_DN24616_c0_g1_i2.p1  ORF type:complete len:169 (+),score=37.31 TRINITY_DN24616_c0_g1_i2:47-508(+)
MLQMLESGIPEALEVLEDERIRRHSLGKISNKVQKLQLMGELGGDTSLCESLKKMHEDFPDQDFNWDKVRELHKQVFQMSDIMTRSWLRSKGLYPVTEQVVEKLAELGLMPKEDESYLRPLPPPPSSSAPPSPTLSLPQLPGAPHPSSSADTA